ncbi:MAG: glycosyltransferase family 2 protein [Chloroflexi bacterium]|nr:glycosyltransferase family 2 protein [Chloroflexota bacterium]
MSDAPEVSVVLPCLNEVKTVGRCVEKAMRAFEASGLRGEVVVSDNGSTDGSQDIAAKAGARVVHAARRGYGSAYLHGIAEARAPIIVMADSDDTYDLGETPRLVAKLREGYDMVLASRLRGNIMPGAMPWLHRYVGNPILTGVLNLLFGLRVSDAHTGMRAFTREAYDRLSLRTTGMEFASEMIVAAAQARLRIAETPITYYPREGESKLDTWRDGWRHLRYLLLRSPTALFIAPGAVMMSLGWLPLIALERGPLTLGGFFFDFHYMIVGSALALLGLQTLLLGLQGKGYLVARGLDRRDALIDWLQTHVTLERGLLLGLILLAIGFGVGLNIFLVWAQHNFANINELRRGLLALTLSVSGTQIMFSSLFLSLLDIQVRE